MHTADNYDDIPLTIRVDTALQVYILPVESGAGNSRCRKQKYSDSGILPWAKMADNMCKNS
jgi:hypothetical protein